MNLSKYRVLVVDDEFLARKLLTGYISKIDSLELAGSCANAMYAIGLLQTGDIDILLLDIHMPELSGLDLVRSLKKAPIVIFTTAYSEYAIDSYELGATDYLLKPIAFPRFFQAINKAIEMIDKNSNLNNKNIDTLALSEESDIHSNANFLTVKADYKIYKINYSDLIYIEGQHEYVTFHTSNRRITAIYSLKSLEEILPPDQFLRIHKSYIVSFFHIEDIEGNVVTVASNKLPIGGSYRDNLMTRLNIK